MSFGAVAVGVVGCTSDSDDPDGGASSGTTSDSDPSTTADPSSTGTPPTTAGSSTTDDSTTGEGTSRSSSSSSTGGSESGTADSGSTSAGAASCTSEFDLHPHTLELSLDMLQADTALEALPILGSGHPHSLDLSGDQVNALLAGQTVTATSSFGSDHEHQVTLQCL